MEHKHHQAVMKKVKIQKRTASPIRFVQTITRHIELNGRSSSYGCRHRNEAADFLCRWCNKNYYCGKDSIIALKRNAIRSIHVEYEVVGFNQLNSLEIGRREARVADKAKKMEIQVAMFSVQNNLPFSLFDKFVNFIKRADIDKNVQAKLKCNRSKCTAIICNVLGKNN